MKSTAKAKEIRLPPRVEKIFYFLGPQENIEHFL
jgi:hypothetical protein